MKKQFIIYSILIVSSLNIFSSCEKYIPNEYVDFRFEIPLSITPIKDTIQAGDILTLQADFSDSVKEVHSGKFYKLKRFDFKTSITFKKLRDTSLDLSLQPGNAGGYKVTPAIGIIAELGGTYGIVIFDTSNNRYRLKVQLIPTQKGISSISFFSRYVGRTTELHFIDLGTNADGSKRVANLRNIWYIINNGNTNFNLYKQNSKLGNLSNIDEYNYEVEATYTFVVK
jgi:hypothetical protein